MGLGLVAALSLAFFAGRHSRSDSSAAVQENHRIGPRSSERHRVGRSPSKTAAGLGREAVTSALQLRDLFKHHGGDSQIGSAMADATLARMSSSEISQLVHDLASAQASSPSYAFTLEIKAACSRWGELDPEAALKFVLSNKQVSFRSAAIDSIFAGIAKTDPALAMAKLSKVEDPSLRQSIKTSVLTSIMVTHPDHWIAAIKSEPALIQNFNLRILTSEWAMDDPAKTAERLKQLPANLQKSSISVLAEVWASKEAPAALAWAQSLPDVHQRNLALGAIAGGLAASDPDAALASLDALPSAARQAGLTAVFRTLVDLDFESAIAKADSLTDPDDRKVVLKLIANGGKHFYDPYGGYSSSPSSPHQLMALLNDLPAGSTRSNTLSQLGQKLSHFSPTEAESILASYPPKEREKLQMGMIQALAYRDPTRAIEIYQSLATTRPGILSDSGILENLARQDPEATLKFALAGESTQEQARGVTAAFGQLAQNDPSAASRRLEELPPGPLYEGALSAVAQAWGQADPEAARSWVQGLTGAAHDRALTQVIYSIARNAPQTAAEMIGEQLASAGSDLDHQLGSAAAQLSQSWTREDPGSASKWVTGLPDGSMKTRAISSMVSSWIGTDFEEATRWLDSQPDGANRDAGVQAMVGSTSYDDPATAFEWANTIHNDSTRIDSLTRVIQQWNQTSPQRARAAVAQADLTAEERTRILQHLESP
jgi:hypothetical protein